MPEVYIFLINLKYMLFVYVKNRYYLQKWCDIIIT